MPAILQRLFCLLASALILTTPALAREQLQISGSSTILPILKRLAPEFTHETGIPLQITGGGSESGLKAARAGTADIGMVSRNISPTEAQGMRITHLGNDAVALIAHENNPLSDISASQIQAIYQGRINHWNELASPSTDKIVRIGKWPDRSTRGLFDGFFGLTATSYPEDVMLVGANSAMILYVSIDPHAIGYVSAGTAQRARTIGAPVKILRVEGHLPDPESIASGKYPYARPLNLLTLENPSTPLKIFLDWITHEKGQQAVEAEGFLRARVQP